jgi:hypothetical protein
MTENGTPEAQPTRLSANGITIDVDLGAILTAVDPRGRYRSYDPDSDEDVYEASSLEHQIVDACAALLVKSLRKDIKESIVAAVRPTIEAEIEAIVRETMNAPVQQTSEWGSPVGTAVPLRELIGKQVQDALKVPELRDGYSAGRGKTMVQRIIDAEVNMAFKKELAAVVAEARTQTLAAVKNSAAEVLTETIARATRGV